MKNKYSKEEDRVKLLTTFAIKNDNFCAILTEDFFEKEELIYILDLLEKILNHQLIEEKIGLFNTRLKFDFWFYGKNQFLDITFIYSKEYNDCYTLLLVEADIEKLYLLLNRQILNIK